MDAFMGAESAGAKKQRIEYAAVAASPLINGEVTLEIDDGFLSIASLFETFQIAYAEINALENKDYLVAVEADCGRFVFSRLGNRGEPFYNELLKAYNEAVLRSLFIKGAPLLTAHGGYAYSEGSSNANGAARISVFDDCVAVLPPSLSARRVPLRFTAGVEKGDFEYTLRLDSGERYAFSRLGYDTVPFADAVEKRIRALRGETLSAVKEIAPALSAAEASRIAGLMPGGSAAPIGRLKDISASFVSALEGKIEKTRAADSYAAFRELSDPTRICVGFKRNEAESSNSAGSAFDGLPGGNPLGALGGFLGGNPMEALGSMFGGAAAEGTQEENDDPFLLWLIAPSPGGEFAAVEFAEENSATYVYRTRGDFDGFARRLNRALEAVGFKRDAIRFTDEELRKPENADYLMASKRTEALRFVRGNFVGRAIHSNAQSWRRRLSELWSGG